MFEKEIEFDFTKNSLLFVKNNMYYKYDDLSNNYHRLQHEYNIYDDENNLIHKYLFNKDTYYDESLDPILHTNEDFCICFKKNYKKIELNLQLHRHNRHGIGNINSEIDDDNENYINIDYVHRNNDNNDTNTESISSNLSKINTNVADISSNLAQISTNTGSISTNSRQISTNKGNISSNLGKINNITKTLMLKNIYFTDFNSTNESFVKELLHLDNTLDNLRTAHIHSVDMECNFKKDDFIEIDCKLLIYHTVYENAKNNIVIYYDLYDEKVDQNKVLFRESHRYYEFPLITNKDRIIAYTKICYKLKYDINKIKFLVHINSATRKTYLILYHHILQKGVNYISIKHYGKS